MERESRQEKERLKGKKEQIKSVLRNQKSRLQVWPKRQLTLTAAVSVLMKEIKRINTVIIMNQKQRQEQE